MYIFLFENYINNLAQILVKMQEIAVARSRILQNFLKSFLVIHSLTFLDIP